MSDKMIDKFLKWLDDCLAQQSKMEDEREYQRDLPDWQKPKKEWWEEMTIKVTCKNKDVANELSKFTKRYRQAKNAKVKT